MSTQDCPNCHYPAPERKKPGKAEQAPQSLYHVPETPEGDTEECPQCFYQPESGPEETEDCPQCFYQPEEKETPEEGEECPQCFYQPGKE